MAQPIVVGYIRSAEGEAAIDAAEAEARLRNAPLIIVHSSKGGSEKADDVVANREALEELSQRLTAEGLKVRVSELARGNDPADDLMEVAEAEDAALIVIGLRRRSPVGKLIMGSNAQSLLLNADCPVLAVKASS